MSTTAILIDIAAVAVIVITAVIAMRRGFVRTALGLAGVILATVLSFTISGTIAQPIYDKYVEPPVRNSITSSISSVTDSSQITDAVNNVFDNLPSFVSSLADQNGLSKDEINENIDNSISGGVTAAADSVCALLEPVAISGIRMIASAVLFIVLSIIFGVIAKFINGLVNMTLLKGVNRSLGAVIGVAKGICYVFVVAVIVSIALPLFGNDFLCFTPEVIDETIVFKLLYGLSPM